MTRGKPSRPRRNPADGSVVRSDGRGWRGDPRAHPDPAMRAAVRAYMALHDGLLPDQIRYVKPAKPPRYQVKLGTEDASRYRRVVDDDGDGFRNPRAELYEHPFERGAGSEIYYDERGRRYLVGGHNKVTERGITDMHRRHYRRHHRFMGVHIPRVNPDYTAGQVLVRGVGLALFAVGANKAMDTLLDPWFSTDRTRSLVKSATGVVVGMVVGRRGYPFLGAGFVAAGVLEVVQLGYREFGLDRWEAKARDRVAAFAASLRSMPAAGTSGLAGTAGPIDWTVSNSANAAVGQQLLPDGRGMLPDPMALRKQMSLVGSHRQAI